MEPCFGTGMRWNRALELARNGTVLWNWHEMEPCFGPDMKWNGALELAPYGTVFWNWHGSGVSVACRLCSVCFPSRASSLLPTHPIDLPVHTCFLLHLPSILRLPPLLPHPTRFHPSAHSQTKPGARGEAHQRVGAVRGHAGDRSGHDGQGVPSAPPADGRGVCPQV